MESRAKRGTRRDATTRDNGTARSLLSECGFTPVEPVSRSRWGGVDVCYDSVEIIGSMVMVGRIGWLLPCTVFFWSFVPTLVAYHSAL